MIGESWKAIMGWPYEVSSLGRVRRSVAFRALHAGRLLKTQENCRWGYVSVYLQDTGRKCRVVVHKLVAEAFLGPRPDGCDIDHMDGDRTNNSLANLRYLPVAENRGARGEENGNSRWPDHFVLRIRDAWVKDGGSVRSLAHRFKIPRSTVWDIVSRTTRNHVRSDTLAQEE